LEVNYQVLGGISIALGIVVLTPPVGAVMKWARERQARRHPGVLRIPILRTAYDPRMQRIERLVVAGVLFLLGGLLMSGVIGPE
jgi:hypothetical protein